MHRKEGDLANAAYWDRRAGNKAANLSLEQKWEALAADSLDGTSK